MFWTVRQLKKKKEKRKYQNSNNDNGQGKEIGKNISINAYKNNSNNENNFLFGQ